MGHSKTNTPSEQLSVPWYLTTVAEQLAWVQAQGSLADSVVRAHLVHNANGQVIGWQCILCSANLVPARSQNMPNALASHNATSKHLNAVAALHRVDRRTLGANRQRVCAGPRDFNGGAPVPRLFGAAGYSLDEVEREEKRVLPPAVTLQHLCGPGEVDVAALLYGDAIAGGSSSGHGLPNPRDSWPAPHSGGTDGQYIRWGKLPELGADRPVERDDDSDLDSSLPTTPGDDVDVSQAVLDKLFDEFITMPPDDLEY
ncbi:hypothetical protein PsYK624_083530 [Phanerochaete sordida]|uniref:Uncharacterized protein n=1 Tax=Phanerochaete sordida TaxID=48140 RepID=A0A9P3LEF6_9APHY|nr:hypothetical protein PsYK624_083530 [Phanerochaete sordida]